MLWASYRHATGTADFNIDFRWQLQSPSKSMLKTQLGIQPLAGVKAHLNASVETDVSHQTSVFLNKKTTHNQGRRIFKT